VWNTELLAWGVIAVGQANSLTVRVQIEGSFGINTLRDIPNFAEQKRGLRNFSSSTSLCHVYHHFDTVHICHGDTFAVLYRRH